MSRSNLMVPHPKPNDKEENLWRLQRQGLGAQGAGLGGGVSSMIHTTVNTMNTANTAKLIQSGCLVEVKNSRI